MLPDRLAHTREVGCIHLHQNALCSAKGSHSDLSQENNRPCTIFSPRGTVMLDPAALVTMDLVDHNLSNIELALRSNR